MTQVLGQTHLKFEIEEIPPKERIFEMVIHHYSDGDFRQVVKREIKADSNRVTFEIPLPQQSSARLYSVFIAGSNNPCEFLIDPSEEELILGGKLYDLKNGSIAIQNSEENTAYFQLLKVLSEYQQIRKTLELEASNFSVYDHDFYTQEFAHFELVESIQHKLNLNLEKISIQFPKTYTSEVLVAMNKVPVRSYKKDWQEYYQSYLALLHDHFFFFVDPKDERMLAHYAFEDKLFEYLTQYVDKDQDATEKAINKLMGDFGENDKIRSFVYSKLLQAFLKLNNEYFVKYLTENYGEGCSLALTLEEMQKMNTMVSTQIGAKAPDILLYDAEQKTQSLKSVASKSEVSMVVFWVGWCAHCQQVMGDLIDVTESFRKHNFSTFALSLEADESTWKKDLSLYKFPKNWINVSELKPIVQSTYAPLYNVSTTPSIFLVDSEGKIIAKNLKADEVAPFLERYFK